MVVWCDVRFWSVESRNGFVPRTRMFTWVFHAERRFTRRVLWRKRHLQGTVYTVCSL